MSNIHYDFRDRTVLITGAASGIGAATARAFAAAGANLVLVDRNEETLQETANALHTEGAELTAVVADVSDLHSCRAMVDHALDIFGALHIAFNNAGIPSTIGGLFEDIEEADWQELLDVNLSGVFYCMKAEVPALKSAGGGIIVNTASIASLVAGPGMAGYVASKHGVGGLTKAAALDLIGHGIRVNGVCPGMVDTPLLAPFAADPELKRQFESSTPIGRVASPEEIARTVLFLASDAASYMVGELLTADGGVTIR